MSFLLQRHVTSEFRQALSQERGGPAQHRCTIERSGLTPDSEGPQAAVERFVQILAAGLGDLREHLAGRRVAHDAANTMGAVTPGTVDEQLRFGIEKSL